MGRVFLLYFDQTPDNHFYLCRTCQAHIALSKDFMYTFADNELTGIVFENAVNVHTEQERRVGARTVEDVYCNSCCNLLGVKIIKNGNWIRAMRVGDFLLHLTKLLKWNGQENVDVAAMAEEEDQEEEDDDAAADDADTHADAAD